MKRNQIGLAKGKDPRRKSPWFINAKGADGKWKKSFFHTEGQRDAEFERRAKEIRLYGVSKAQVSHSEAMVFSEMRRIAGELGQTPMEIFQRGVLAVSGSPTHSVRLCDAAEEFLSELEHRLKLGLITRTHFLGLRVTVNALVAHSGRRTVASHDRGLLRSYINGMDVSQQTKKNRAKMLSQLFNWCREEGYTSTNPVPSIPSPDRIPAHWSVGEAHRFIRHCEKTQPSLVPMIALQWFAAIRPGATQRMAWDNIDFDRRRILIPPHANKLKQSDVVEGLPDTVFIWLEAHRKDGGLVVPSGWRRAVSALHTDYGYHGYEGGMRWPEDVARHTCASHLLAMGRSINEVRDILGHTTSTTTLKHYLVKGISREDGDVYFALRPEV